MPEPVDDGYDGYYNDVQPIDSGRIHDRIDPELTVYNLQFRGVVFQTVKPEKTEDPPDEDSEAEED